MSEPQSLEGFPLDGDELFEVSADHRKKIREAALHATAGPWIHWDDGDIGTAYPVASKARTRRNHPRRTSAGGSSPAPEELIKSKWIANSSHENGAYLALLDPQTIIALLRRIEELEEKLKAHEK